MNITRTIIGTTTLALALGGCGGAVHNVANVVHHGPHQATCSADLDHNVSIALHKKVNSPAEFYRNLDNVATPFTCRGLSPSQIRQISIHLPSFVKWETSLVNDMNKALRGTGQPVLTVATLNREILAGADVPTPSATPLAPTSTTGPSDNPNRDIPAGTPTESSGPDTSAGTCPAGTHVYVGYEDEGCK